MESLVVPCPGPVEGLLGTRAPSPGHPALLMFGGSHVAYTTLITVPLVWESSTSLAFSLKTVQPMVSELTPMNA